MSYGHGAIGELAIGETLDEVIPPTRLDEILADGDAAIRYLVEFTGVDLPVGSPVDTTTFYYSSHGLTTRASDTPASQYYDAVVIQPGLIQAALQSASGYGGVAVASGEIVLNNADESLDTLIVDYALEGQTITVKAGGDGWVVGDYETVWKGVIRGITTGSATTELRLEVEGLISLAAEPMHQNYYAGTGGSEGPAELEGTPVPIAAGTTRWAEPIAVDRSANLYQFNDFAVFGTQIDSVQVFDNGVALTAITGSPGPVAGEYIDNEDGTFTLGAAPDGPLLAHLVVWYETGATNRTSVGPFVDRWAGDIAGIADADLDLASFAQFNDDHNEDSGIYVRERLSTVDAMDRLLRGVGGGFLAENVEGQWKIGTFARGTGDPILEFDETTISNIQRLRPPNDINPPIYRWRLAYNETLNVVSDPAGATTDANKTTLAEQFRYVTAEDLTVLDTHASAQVAPDLHSYMDDEADAQAAADRLLALYKVQPGLYRFSTVHGLKLRIGDEVKITFDRWDLTAGKAGRVVATLHDFASRRSDITVFV